MAGGRHGAGAGIGRDDRSGVGPAGVAKACKAMSSDLSSHTWGLFESEMPESWNTTIGPALGV